MLGMNKRLVGEGMEEQGGRRRWGKNGTLAEL